MYCHFMHPHNNSKSLISRLYHFRGSAGTSLQKLSRSEIAPACLGLRWKLR